MQVITRALKKTIWASARKKLSKIIAKTALRSGTLSGIVTALTTAGSYIAGVGFDPSLVDWSQLLPWSTSVGAAVGVGTSVVVNDNKIQTTSSLPRGIRNRNPGNIKQDSRWEWQGEIGSDDAGFVIFDSDLLGIRALARDLKNKQVRRNLVSVQEILARYAPPSENDTAAYVNFVSERMKVRPNDFVDLSLKHVASQMIKAIIQYENGQQPYSSELIRNAIEMA